MYVYICIWCLSAYSSLQNWNESLFKLMKHDTEPLSDLVNVVSLSCMCLNYYLSSICTLAIMTYIRQILPEGFLTLVSTALGTLTSSMCAELQSSRWAKPGLFCLCFCLHLQCCLSVAEHMGAIGAQKLPLVPLPQSRPVLAPTTSSHTLSCKGQQTTC